MHNCNSRSLKSEQADMQKTISDKSGQNNAIKKIFFFKSIINVTFSCEV